jgi:hypothetical protein
MLPEARHSPRYPLVAAAELLDVQSNSRFNTKTSDLSLTGCYLDMLNPPPVETRVKVTITYHDSIFEALGKVVFSLPNMGIGVAFTEIDSNNHALLHAWINELALV